MASYAYIELLLAFGEAITSTAINKEDHRIHVGEVFFPDLTRCPSDNS